LYLPFTSDFAILGQILFVFTVYKWFCNFSSDLACFCRLQVILQLYVRFSLFLPFTTDFATLGQISFVFAVYKWFCKFSSDFTCFCRLQVVLQL
jgi:hypothetical protein